MEPKDVKAFGLIIVESLPDEDKRTGYELYNLINKEIDIHQPTLFVEYVFVNSKKDLMEFMKSTQSKAIDENKFFILHFEIHGYDGGFCLASHECVEWSEIYPYFERINVHYKNSLTFTLAVCKGATIIKNINPLKIAPFRLLIASEKNIYVNELERGFKKFYKHFFANFSPKEALDMYNAEVGDEKDKLLYWDIEHIFDNITDYDPKSVKDDVKQLFEKAKLNKNNFLMKS